MTRTLDPAVAARLDRLVRLHDHAQRGITAEEYAGSAGVLPVTAKTYLCGLAKAGLAKTVSRAPTSWVPLYTADGEPVGDAPRLAEPAEAERHLADAERLIEDALRGGVSGYPLQNRLRTAVLPLLRLARESLVQ